jgi:hypothetical protein
VAWSADTESALPGPNESDLFYVLPDTEVEIEPAQRAVPRELSLPTEREAEPPQR